MRKAITGTATAFVLAASLATASPAANSSAATPGSGSEVEQVLGTLFPGLAQQPEAQRGGKYKPYGFARSKDHVLKQGCHRYRFTYRVKPPTEEWAAEFFLVNPNGRGILNDAADASSDPKSETRTWGTDICRYSTVYGRHTIKMKVTYQVGRQNRVAWVKPTHFNFTRP